MAFFSILVPHLPPTRLVVLRVIWDLKWRIFALHCARDLLSFLSSVRSPSPLFGMH